VEKLNINTELKTFCEIYSLGLGDRLGTRPCSAVYQLLFNLVRLHFLHQQNEYNYTNFTGF
jgi:hypothetical protein